MSKAKKKMKLDGGILGLKKDTVRSVRINKNILEMLEEDNLSVQMFLDNSLEEYLMLEMELRRREK